MTPVPEGLKDEAPRHRARICPKCGKVTTSFECCFERGSPMFPQTDDYTVTQPQDVVLNADHESGLDRAFAAGYRAGLEEAREAVEADELPPFIKSAPLPDDRNRTSEPWALRILAEEIWFQERGDWPDEQDAEMFNDPDWVKRFLTARTVARCWDSARAALVSLGKEGERDQGLRDAGASGATTDGEGSHFA